MPLYIIGYPVKRMLQTEITMDKDSKDCYVKPTFSFDVSLDHLSMNRESIAIIWFDPMITKTSVDMSFVTRLRQLNDYIVFYSQESRCIEYFTSKRKSEYIIAILNGSALLDTACQCEQVRAILIVDSNSSVCKENLDKNSQSSKVMGIFDEPDSAMIKLPQVIADVENQAAIEVTDILSTFDRKQKSFTDLRQELASFLWCQGCKGKY